MMEVEQTTEVVFGQACARAIDLDKATPEINRWALDGTGTLTIGTSASYGELNNCGFRCLSRLPLSSLSEQAKQNIVCMLLNHGDYIQYIMAPATNQLHSDTMVLFKELGAVELGSAPNQYHSPHLAHFFLLNLYVNPKVLKYVDIVKMPTRGGGYGNYARPGVYRPRWFTDTLLKSGDVQPVKKPEKVEKSIADCIVDSMKFVVPGQVFYDDDIPQRGRIAGPPRDAYGMFKKVIK